MTGIEVFANLVSAYQGPAKKRSKRAFMSLLIVMGTTSLTMLIVGPAILALSNPMDTNVSVFTQTMNHLLPMWLSYIGTFLSVAVLLSAAAASVHGIQNLGLGLRYRHYVPAWFGSLNRFEVADKPVWLTIAVCMLCFCLFGTHEGTYLALYAAGVFILLSLTSWATVKRLVFKRKEYHQPMGYVIGAILAATLTTVATVVIFDERFLAGAWIYFLLIPIFYVIFGFFRKRLEKPALISERLGAALSASMLPQFDRLYFHGEGIRFKNILVPLDQSPASELALSCAQTLARNYDGHIHLLTVLSDAGKKSEPPVGMVCQTIRTTNPASKKCTFWIKRNRARC